MKTGGIMTNLECIDYACMETYHRYIGASTDPNYIYQHLNYAIQRSLQGDFAGFTRNNGARDCIQGLSRDEIEAELLKNLVRTVSYKQRIDDPEANNGRALLSLSSIPEGVRMSDIENGLYNELVNNEMNHQRFRTERDHPWVTRLQDPKIMNTLICSYVHNRYERRIARELEEVQYSSIEQEVLDSIDCYYLRAQTRQR